MFVNGIELKEDLKKLVAHYSALPENVLKSGLNHFAGYPPEDTTFLTTQLWDKYLPGWRTSKQRPQIEHDPESEKKLVEELNQMTDSPELTGVIGNQRQVEAAGVGCDQEIIGSDHRAARFQVSTDLGVVGSGAVGKIKNLYNQQLIIKGGTGTQTLQQIKDSLLSLQTEMQGHA